MLTALKIALPLLALQVSGALACGYCVEDRVAAAYDHALIVRALERKHGVAFLAIEGPLAASVELQSAITGMIEATRGVDRGTARVSLASASLSFAYDPARPGLGPIMRALENKLVAKGLRLSMLRVINEAPSSRPLASSAREAR
jgi:hypothetical protein